MVGILRTYYVLTASRDFFYEQEDLLVNIVKVDQKIKRRNSYDKI